MTLRPATPADGDGPFEAGFVKCGCHGHKWVERDESPDHMPHLRDDPTTHNEACELCHGAGWRFVPVVRVDEGPSTDQWHAAREKFWQMFSKPQGGTTPAVCKTRDMGKTALLERAKGLRGAVVEKDGGE